MNIDHTERKVASKTRIQINDDVTLLLEEGDADAVVWVTLLGRTVLGVATITFSMSVADLLALCRAMADFGNKIAPQESSRLVLEPAL